MSFPGIPKKPGWSPQAAAAQAQSYAAPAAPQQPVAWWLQQAPAGQAYPVMNPSQYGNAARANQIASRTINWQRAYNQGRNLASYERQIAQQTGLNPQNVSAHSRRSGVYFNLRATGSQTPYTGVPQTTHFSMHNPHQSPGTIGQFHLRSDYSGVPRYEARSFPQMQQGAPSFGTFVTPQGTSQGQYPYGAYPAGHPVATTYAPALASAATQFAQTYGTRRQGNAMNTSGGRGKRKSTKKAKKTRRLKK